jgi:hypothetical protein
MGEMYHEYRDTVYYERWESCIMNIRDTVYYERWESCIMNIRDTVYYERCIRYMVP